MKGDTVVCFFCGWKGSFKDFKTHYPCQDYKKDLQEAVK